MTPGAPRAATRTALPRVVLRKNLARSIRSGHPWIYRDALTAPEGLADGALVFVVDADRKSLARGYCGGGRANYLTGMR